MSRFCRELEHRVIVFDGAMGTSIHEYDLDLYKDYLDKENCTEVLVQTRPDVIQAIHESFLESGADAVETDTFGSNQLVLAEFDLVDQTHALNRQAAQIARAACEKYDSADKPRFVIGSMGPGTKLLTLAHTSWDLMFESYREQARGLIDGGVDALLIETCQDLLQIKCAINSCLAALDEKNKTTIDIPLMVQVTIETNGTMLLGSEIAVAVAALESYPIMSLGMNCATGPAEMVEHVQYLAKHWNRFISVQPNAGLPMLVEGHVEYPLKPKPFAEQVSRFVQQSGVNIVGGCCGTTPEHIARLARTIGKCQPVQIDKSRPNPVCTSLYGVTEFRQQTSILNIGERTNASGSRQFKQMLESDQWDDMVSLARQQVREGSHLIDVNVDYAGRDNARDMGDFVGRLVRHVRAPLMLDSTQPATIEAGLKLAAGKCVINSANLEDGEDKFSVLIGMAKKYGAAIVLGTIDEDPEEAMARTADRKIAIAKRMYDLAVNKHGLAPCDLIFDPLVLPITTGMDKDRRSGLETIEGVRRIAEQLPQCQITCGLSNVSFGLKPAARQVLNSVFLHELINAGLTSAILHASKILPRNRIDDVRWNSALDLIYNRSPGQPVTLNDGTKTSDSLQIYIDQFLDDAVMDLAKQDISELPLEERMRKHIVDGEKKNLIKTLEQALKKYTALDIINEHLLDGMKVVGDLFGSGQMQLPFVLQSAEVMKMAVGHLEQYMDKSDGQTKGTIVLATVRGDVHDIGKNLVDIILSNNGFTVHNLGIKQPIPQIIRAWKQHQADAIGLSGLLVKSVQVMEENLHELIEQDISVPVILGGAALSRHHCEHHLRSIYDRNLYYGKDAFEGLAVMNHLVDGKSDLLNDQIDDRLSKRAAVAQRVSKRGATNGQAKRRGVAAVIDRSSVVHDVSIPTPPFWGDRLVEAVPLDQVFTYINTVALFRGQWQFKKGSLSNEEYEAMVEDEAIPVFEQLKQQCCDEKILQPKVVYGYYPCTSCGDDLIIYDPDDHHREIERLTFPRQRTSKRLCISDFFRSSDSVNGERDIIGMTCVTVGARIGECARKLFEADKYSEYLYLHGFGVESAEALAEMWHKRIRQELGLDAEDATSVRQLFTQHYRGSRYSFGYPACPDLSDQETLFRLLRPDRIGCVLTDNWQIDPEQSTTAIIVHHPEAKYFSV